MRILGGSLGISASTVLLRNEVCAQLGRLSSPEQLKTLGNLGASVSDNQRDVMRHIYSEAFRKGMIVATAVSAAAFLLTLIGYRQRGQDVADQRAALIQHEQRRKALEGASPTTSD